MKNKIKTPKLLLHFRGRVFKLVVRSYLMRVHQITKIQRFGDRLEFTQGFVPNLNYQMIMM